MNFRVFSATNKGLEKEADFIIFDRAWDYFAAEVANGANSIVLLFQRSYDDEDIWDLVDEYRDEFSFPENLEKEEVDN